MLYFDGCSKSRIYIAVYIKKMHMADLHMWLVAIILYIYIYINNKLKTNIVNL